MKKFLTLLLAAAMTLSLAACGSKNDGNVNGGDSQPADALALLNTVWSSYTDDDKFAVVGGDYDEANMTEDAPGRFGVEDGDTLDSMLGFPAADADKLTDAPEMLANLCDDCRTHFDRLKAYLDAMDIGYTVDPRIVRGLDYYTKTVFEIITDTENGPLTVCGGGRYDGLVEELGGPATPGIGFGMGVERMMMVQDARGCAPKAPALYDAFVCTLGDQARYEAARLVRELREAGIKADMDHAARSLKAQFKYANKVGVSRVLVLAEDELSRGVVKLRDMDASAEEEVPRGQIVGRLQRLLG